MRRVEKLETAVEPRFQEHFVGAMGIPHTTEPFPRLAAVDRPAGARDLGRRRRAPAGVGAATPARPRRSERSTS